MTAALLLIPLLQATALRADAQTAPATRAPGGDAPLTGSELYWAQVLAQVGAEGLLATLGLCPPLGTLVALASPAVGALAVDWAGRELGLTQGSQVAALIGSYGMQCLGSGLAVGGGVALYLGGLLGPVLLAGRLGGVEQMALPLLVLGGGVGVLALGSLISVSRPLITPLLWQAFAPAAAAPDGEPEASAPAAVAPATAAAVVF